MYYSFDIVTSLIRLQTNLWLWSLFNWCLPYSETWPIKTYLSISSGV